MYEKYSVFLKVFCKINCYVFYLMIFITIPRMTSLFFQVSNLFKFLASFCPSLPGETHFFGTSGRQMLISGVKDQPFSQAGSQHRHSES